MLGRHTVTPLALLVVLLFSGRALASHHYTTKQIDVLATRVGNRYWVVAINGKTPPFLVAPRAEAALFQPGDNESFQITDLVGRARREPYYKVRFDSGKEAYLSPDVFLEQLNAGFATVDPLAEEKKKAAEKTAEEERRLAWIRAQPWSRSVKEAAIARTPVVGMTTGEVRMVVGEPSRIANVKAPDRPAEEQWFYPDGSVLIFHDGALTRREVRSPQPSS